MRIAYISPTPLSDLDISQISEAQKIMDVTYYITVTPNTRQRAAIDLSSFNKKFGIYCALDIPELAKYGTLLDLSKVYVVNYTWLRTWNPESFFQAYKFYRHLKESGFDVFHFTWPCKYNEFIMYLLRKKMVLTVHDPFPHSSQVSFIREIERKVAFSMINRLVLLNKNQKDDFVKFYKLHNKRILEAKLSRYDYLKIYENNSVQKTEMVLFFGSILSHKGLDYLLPAMEIVHEKCPNAKLVIAGKGKMYFDISPYLGKDYIDIRNRFIQDEELAELIQQCSVVAVPYIDATQSGVVMSAYAFNKPCVATDVGGLPEMVVHEQMGLIVPPKDVQALADAICELLDDNTLQTKFSSNIEKEYSTGMLSWTYIVNQYKQMYDSVL